MSSFRKPVHEQTPVNGRVPGEPHPDWQTNLHHFYKVMDTLTGWDITKYQVYVETKEDIVTGKKIEIEQNWRIVWNDKNIALNAEFCFFTATGNVYPLVQFHVNDNDFRKRLQGAENYLINKRIVLGFKPNNN